MQYSKFVNLFFIVFHLSIRDERPADLSGGPAQGHQGNEQRPLLLYLKPNVNPHVYAGCKSSCGKKEDLLCRVLSTANDLGS